MKPEIKYLQIINNQNNKFIINDNIRNAEICADSLFYRIDTYNNDVSSFFLLLSESYYLLKKYDLALFTLLQQRILFYSDSINIYSKKLLNQCLNKTNKKLPASFSILEKSLDTILFVNSAQKVDFLFSITFFINSKNTKHKLLNLITFYEKYFNQNVSFGMAKWKLLNTAGINLKTQTKYLLINDFNNPLSDYDNQDLLYNLPIKLKNKILNHNT
ncbi:MAG: hypothetical protein JXR68_01140 [Bacteroidales bacterium]|nr:hypothetical protein [Bacteroidales bacterium]